MTTTDWANIARCAELRMDSLWQDACAASFANNRSWEQFHDRRWREHSTYMAAQAMARYIWRQRL